MIMMVNPSQNAAMFVPHVFRPFWQPNSRRPFLLYQDITQVERLTKKLDIAERKLDEYARLIASLSAELRRNQDLICYACREHIIRLNLTPVSPPPTGSTLSASQLSCPPTNNFFAPTGTTIASLDPLRTTYDPLAVADPIASSSGVHGQSPRSSRLSHLHSPDPCVNNRSIAATLSSDPQVTLPTSPYFAEVNSKLSQPAISVVPETADACLGQPKPNHPDWSVEYNPKITRRLNLHVTKTFTYTTRVLSVKFSRDGKYLAMGLKGGEVHIYNMMTGSKSVLAERSATVFYTDAGDAPFRIWDVTFSLDNKCIATGGSQGRINIWEIGRRRIRATFKHTKLVKSLDFSPDGRHLVSASCDNSACIWNIRDGSRIALWQSSFDFTSAAFSADGRYVAAGNDDGFLRIWNVRTGWLASKCNIGDRGELDSSSVIFTPDGKVIATGNNSLKCWDARSLTNSHAGRPGIKDDTTSQLNQIWGVNWYTESITAISLSPDTRWIVLSSLDDRDNLCIMDARSGNWVCTLKAHASRVRGVHFSPAGHYIVSGGEDRQVKLWRYKTAK